MSPAVVAARNGTTEPLAEPPIRPVALPGPARRRSFLPCLIPQHRQLPPPPSCQGAHAPPANYWPPQHGSVSIRKSRERPLIREGLYQMPSSRLLLPPRR